MRTIAKRAKKANRLTNKAPISTVAYSIPVNERINSFFNFFIKYVQIGTLFTFLIPPKNQKLIHLFLCKSDGDALLHIYFPDSQLHTN